MDLFLYLWFYPVGIIVYALLAGYALKKSALSLRAKKLVFVLLGAFLLFPTPVPVTIVFAFVPNFILIGYSALKGGLLELPSLYVLLCRAVIPLFLATALFLYLLTFMVFFKENRLAKSLK